MEAIAPSGVISRTSFGSMPNFFSTVTLTMRLSSATAVDRVHYRFQVIVDVGRHDGRMSPTTADAHRRFDQEPGIGQFNERGEMHGSGKRRFVAHSDLSRQTAVRLIHPGLRRGVGEALSLKRARPFATAGPAIVTTIGAACAGAVAELFSRLTSLASRSNSGTPRASAAAALPFLGDIAHAASSGQPRSLRSRRRFLGKAKRPDFRRAEQAGEMSRLSLCAKAAHGNSECHALLGLHAIGGWGLAYGQVPGFGRERSPNRCVSPISEDVLRHGTVRHGLEPCPVQGGQQHTGIAVAHVGFSSGRLRQPAHDRFDHAAGTVTATREPHRVVALVIGDVEESLCARFVIAREMSARSEALRVEDDLRRPVRVQAIWPTPALSRQLPQTCAKPARLRRSCTSPCSSERPADVAPHRQPF